MKYAIAAMFASFSFAISPWFLLPCAAWGIWGAVEMFRDEDEEEEQ
jgi:hypothetical protein